jgi:hypothetical protein
MADVVANGDQILGAEYSAFIWGKARPILGVEIGGLPGFWSISIPVFGKETAKTNPEMK